MAELVYYKVNVPYPVGVRWNVRDNIGRVLSSQDPYVAVKAEDLRDFSRANHFAIEKSLIIKTTEPSIEIESGNMIDDEKAAAIVKNELSLKKALADIDSISIVVKLLDQAKLQGVPSKRIKLIEAKLEEFNESEAPDDMRGVDSN